MNSKHLALALALSSTLAAGAAHAGGRPEVQWSVTIGSPHVGVMVGVPIYAPRVYAEPVYETVYEPVYRPIYGRHVPAPRYYPQPVVVVPQRGVHGAGWHHGHRGVYRDADHDGIPNRHDRDYNPRWDRDGDGVPNHHDRHDRNPYRR